MSIVFILVLIRVLLAAVFLVASLAKLADPAGSRQALRDFGVPAPLAAPFGLLLPLAELVVAIALLPSSSTWWAALGALVLLLLFVAGIGSNLARGRRPDCHCFGQLHSAPAGWPTLLRNLVLAILAGFVVVCGQSVLDPGIFDWLIALPMIQRSEVVGALVVVALLVGAGWLLFQIMAQQGRLLLRIEAAEAKLASDGQLPQAPPASPALAVRGLPVGTPAPAFAIPNLMGETMTLAALRTPGKPLVLIFSDSGCGPCNALGPEIGHWQREYATNLVIVLISRGTAQVNRARASEHGLTHVLLQHDREVAQAYEVLGTPSAVLVRPDGTIGSPLAQGAEAIRALIQRPGRRMLPMVVPHRDVVAASASPPAGLQRGEAAPAFSLPDLTGQLVHLADFQGSETLLLFWNPACGFCQRLLPDLKAWEARPPETRAGLLVVSTGAVAANTAMGLHSPVVLDEDWKIGNQFGASGTPTAVLIDAEGKIASALAVGAPAVLALAGSGQYRHQAALLLE